jgi:hypothetical protein
MKIISHKVAVDPTTFLPELEIVMRLPLKQSLGHVTADAEFFEKFGRDFFSLVEQSRST